MNFTIVIPFYNGHTTINRLIKSIPNRIPIIIVDDLSDTRLTKESVFGNKTRNIKILHLNNKGYFAGAVNAGIKACNNDVLILNQDTFFEGKEWLNLLEKHSENYGLMGEGVAGTHPAWSMGYIHGTFMFIKREVIDKIGLLNEFDYPLWGNTCLYQLKACRAGFAALPFRPIPDFYHSRRERYGDSIQTLLNKEPEKQDWLIRVPPMISVIIPSYNHGRYLESAINSLISGNTDLGYMPGQTFQSFEVIIVDDESTDNTAEIGRALSDPWKGIHYIRRRANGGTAAANNTGIARAHGRFITVLCADDMMKPDRLHNLYREAEQYPDSVIYDDLQQFKNGELTRQQTMHEYDFDKLLDRNVMHCGILFKKEAWQKVGGYPEIMGQGREDWAMNVRLGVHGFCGKRIPYAGYLYRREGQNRTLTNTSPSHHARFSRLIQMLHPEAYKRKDERPMSCCGGGRSTPLKAKTNGGGGSLPGAEAGMTLIEYVGGNAGKETFYGPVTGTRYEFSTSENVGNVDTRDVAGFLDMWDRGNQVFIEFTPPAEFKADPVVEIDTKAENLPETPAESEEAEETEVMKMTAVDLITADETETQLVYDPNKFTVAGFIKEIEGLEGLTAFSKSEYETMLLMETEGKDRKGITKYLENAIG